MRTLLAAAAALVACTGSASAGLFFVNLTVNNPSVDPWIAVDFRITPVEGVNYGPGGFGSQLRFSDLALDFSTTKSFSTVDIIDEFHVRYDFASFAPMATGDTETFTLGIVIDQFVPFKIQQFFTPVPTPGAAALAAFALAMGAIARRRRVA